jgi:CheY-like chemotaxis protein
MFPHRPSAIAGDVLIAEDDPDIRENLRFLLEHAGNSCAEAEDGTEAVEVARLSPPRLLLLDLMMPAHSEKRTVRKSAQDLRH